MIGGMMFKGTPGPWAISSRSASCIRTADQEQRIAYLETADNTFETCEANGRLIAAAPELLEALMEAIEFCNAANNFISGQDLPASSRWIAAVAKALGEQK